MSASPVLLALGLVLVIEGVLPLLTPGGWREAMGRIAAMRDGQIRFIGLCAVVGGLVLIGVSA